MSTRLADLRDRAGSWSPQRLDAVLGAIVFVEALLEAALAGAGWPARFAAAAPAALVGGGVALRRRRPLVAAALAVTGVGVVASLQDPVQQALQGIYFGWLFVTYSLAARETGRRLAAGIAITLGGTVALMATREGAVDVTQHLLVLILFVAGPVLAGRLLHHRLRLSRALGEKTSRLERERAIRAEEAVNKERVRIAGELHDVVAHALGAMTIQAAAARRLATRDAARAAGAFEAVEQTGREALGELRTLLDVLRAGEPDAALEPQPGMAGIGQLVDRVRAAGLPVDFEVHGSPPDRLPTGVDLTAYRVVQEALTAALEQGGAGRARVWVGFDEHEVQIRVEDDGSHQGARRLLGMRERVHLCGGEVAAGTRRDGGHRVRARLPLQEVHA